VAEKIKSVFSGEPVPSATVILTREYEGEFQVYLLRRCVKSGFMGGFYVFPGGIIDPEDRDAEFWRDHVDMPEFSDISCEAFDPGEVLAFGVAGIRETFEEAGVLLVNRNRPGSSENRFARELRRSGRLQPGWLKAWAGKRNWELAFSALLPWAHWITPVQMKRRYDTRFFIAKIPDGLKCSPDNREMTHGIWVNPQKGLEKNLAGQIPLSPPTLVTLHGLTGVTEFKQVRATSEKNRWGPAIKPRLVMLEKGAVILEPWDPCFEDENPAIDSGALADSVLEVKEPFSRLWNGDGIWKPVRCPDLS
jgi:8-oxo-dGTP pyrophosphatase MutT (NUDIX family)